MSETDAQQTRTQDPAMASDAASPNDDDVAAARAEAEQRRAALSAGLSTLRVRIERAVEHWQDRASPESVRRRTTAYVAHERDELARTLTRRVRRHPYATALLGSGLAMTTWGTIKKLPKGLLLAGAGLYLMSRDETDKTDKARDARPAGQIPAARLPARPADIQRPARPLGVKSADGRASPPRPGQRPRKRRSIDGPVGRTVKVLRDHPVEIGALGLALGTALAVMSPGLDVRTPSARGVRGAGKRVRATLAGKRGEDGTRTLGRRSAKATSGHAAGSTATGTGPAKAARPSGNGTRAKNARTRKPGPPADS